MKKFILLLSFTLALSVAHSQSGAKWSTGGDNISSGNFLGTTNNFPLIFKTNSTQWMTLGTNGVLNLNKLAGTGNRLLQTDASGNISVFPMATSNDVLYGNGTWGSLPAGATAWKLNGNDLFNTNSGNIGIGTFNPQYKLDIFGDVRISNNLYVGGGIIITDRVNASSEVRSTTLKADSIVMDSTKAIYGSTRIAGDLKTDSKLDVTGNASFNGNLRVAPLVGVGDRIVYADASGNLRVGPNPSPTVNGPCLVGAIPWYEGGNTSVADNTIGTCDNVDFILKTKSINHIWIKADGKIGFQHPTPQEKFHFDGGTVRMDDAYSLGLPPLTDPNYKKTLIVNGDVVLANHIPPTATGSTNNGMNGIEFLGGDDGTGTKVPTRRGITTDANPNGHLNFYINTNQSPVGFNFKNGNGNKTLMVLDASGLLTLNGQSSSGNSLVIKDGIANTTNFVIKTTGATEIHTQVTGIGSGGTDALTIWDNTNKVNFKVKATGFVYAREVQIMNTSAIFPDYVFDKSYKLIDIPELESYILKNKHLPGFESANFYEKNGIQSSEMFIKQQEKIEELTLYIIELEKRIKALEKTK